MSTENKNYYVAWDTETDLIGINAIVPDLICSSFYDLQTQDNDLMLWSPKKDHSEALAAMLESCHVIVHNAAFDTSVAARMFPALRPLIWKAYREGRIHCTMIREMLLNLATMGEIDKVPISGSGGIMTYALSDLVLQYLNIDIKASKEDPDSVRLNFSLVKDKRLSEWPSEFVEYAKQDAVYHGRVFLAQEVRNNKLKEERGIDAFKTEGFRAMVHYSLQQMTATGTKMDKEEVLRVTKEFETLYNDPALVQPLVEQGLWIPAQPPQPYANGAKDHRITCKGNKENPEYRKNKSVKDCDCPVKMKGATPACGSDIALHDYVWAAAKKNPLIEVWASDSLLKTLKEGGLADRFIEGRKQIRLDEVERYALECVDCDPASQDIDSRPKGWSISVDEEWRTSFACLDPVLEKFDDRKKVEKIVTSYLPRLYWAEGRDQCPDVLEGCEGRLDGKVPADRVHSGFSPLKETGRCSSRAATKGRGKNLISLYPSWNGQQVDPRVRGCAIPEEGNVLFSIDYSAMELGTTAQKCLDLFGHSVLADKINAGVDTHAYLGAQIAFETDPYFRGACGTSDRDQIAESFFDLKGFAEPCDSEEFRAVKGGEDVSWASFFKHYRTFAKPTGLGYPGGLGPVTFVAYAKATYGVAVDLKTAELLREVWRATFPEIPQYLNYVNKSCEDPWAAPEYVETDNGEYRKMKWYCYDTPLGMHRARCSYTACANGGALQSPSAEGALLGLCDIMEACDTGDLAGMVWPQIFIHDEVFGEMVLDDKTTDRIRTMMAIMTENMRKITPDVESRAEPCLMYRWNKAAEAVWEEEDGKKILVPWVPKEKAGA